MNSHTKLWAIFVPAFIFVVVFILIATEPKHHTRVRVANAVQAHKRAPRHVYEMDDHTHAYQGDDGWWYWFVDGDNKKGPYWVTQVGPRNSTSRVVREYEEEDEEVEELYTPAAPTKQPEAESEDKQSEMQEQEPDSPTEASPEAAPADSSSDGGDGGGGSSD